MYRYRSAQNIVNIIVQEIFKPLNRTSFDTSKRFFWSGTNKFNRIVKLSFGESKYQKERSNYGPGSLYLLGVLGFFETQEEEETIEDKILRTIKMAIVAMQREQIPKAETLLNRAFEMSDLEKMEDVKTQIIDLQANMSLQLGDWSRAESLFKLVAQRMVRFGLATTTDNAIVEISIKLAEIYRTTARYEEAQIGYLYCVNVQHDKIEKDGVRDEDTLLLAAWASHGLSQLYISISSAGASGKKRMEEALDLGKTAYKYASEAVGPDSHQALAIQSDIATTLALLGDFDKALKTLSECAKIAKDKYEDIYATLQVNKGTVFLQKGDPEKAERICRAARRIGERANDQEATARAADCVKRAKELREKLKQDETR